MPLAVEPVLPKWTLITISLVFAFVVDAFEQMRAWFTFCSFEPWRIDFEIGFATPCHVSMMFKFVGAITYLASCSMCSAGKGSVFPLLVVLVLRDTRIYGSASDSGNVATYVEAPID